MKKYPLPEHEWISIIEAPLYGQVFPSHSGDDELERMLAEVERITKAIDGPLGWVTDVSNILHATARQRKMYADYDERLKFYDKKWCTGTAIICTGSFVRGVVTAIHWMTPPVYPFKVFGSRRDGELWARQQLIARGVEVSPEPQSLVSQIGSVKQQRAF